MDADLDDLDTALYVTPAVMPALDDDIRPVDSTPVECTRSRPTVARGDLAGRAQNGY